MIRPYYQDKRVTQYCSDALSILSELENGSIDLLATDPPYGIGFMGKDWDRALPDKQIWRECLRVLKPGAFAFVMSIPRADCLSRMIISLEEAGFQVNFTPIYWAYASGFPKAQNIGKAVDKRSGVERGKWANPLASKQTGQDAGKGLVGARANSTYIEPIPATPQARALDGSYGGFQPKPAVEVIIVAMKPLFEKTFVGQALKNRKGITWLDDCRVPYESEGDKEGARFGTQMDIRGGNFKTPQGIHGKNILSSQSGRFPANLLVSDDVLNDGKITKSGKDAVRRQESKFVEHKLGKDIGMLQVSHQDSGSFSRYFDLDKWVQKTFPFLIVPKASKSEKNKYLEGRGTGSNSFNRKCLRCGKWQLKQGLSDNYTCHCETPEWEEAKQNNHPTVKPLKLMAYLITLGSRAGDTVLDPFLGSGTTALACQLLNRHCIGIEIKEKYCEIAAKRCSQDVMELKI